MYWYYLSKILKYKTNEQQCALWGMTDLYTLQLKIRKTGKQTILIHLKQQIILLFVKYQKNFQVQLHFFVTFSKEMFSVVLYIWLH